MRRELARLSAAHRQELPEPARRVAWQLSLALQDFRSRLSGRMLETPGVPLKTSQVEMTVAEPREPDVRAGKIFDRNWERLSWAIPMSLARGIVLAHFCGKVERGVEMNLARLTRHWHDAIAAACSSLLAEARRRLESLRHALAQVLRTTGGQAEATRADLEQPDRARAAWRQGWGRGPASPRRLRIE